MESRPMQSFKPERIPFLWPRLLAAMIVAGLLSVGLLVLAAFTSGWVVAAIPVMVILLVVPSMYGAHVAYTKEAYTLQDDHLVRAYGGMFSDGRNELDIRNITHVRLRLPWPRHRLFGIGDVRVESAGSAQAEVTFQSVKEPEVLYARIQELMRDNGYALGRNDILHQESPSPLAALVEIGQVVVGLLFAGFWVGGLAIGAVAEGGPGFLLPVLGLGVLSALAFVTGAALRYVDVTRRTYTVYDDVVEYTEGFLTCDNAFIPFENIADAAVNRTVVDQMLGLYDVAVSCQGSGSEVKFRKLSNGPAMQEAISKLVASARLVEKKAPASKPVKEGESPERPAGAPKPSREIVSAEDAWTADLKMSMPSALTATLPLLLTGPVWLVAAIGVAIRAAQTNYRVGVDAISSEFSFIGSKTQQFAFDKVTGVQVQRTPVHNAFGTVSIQIWSIGAPQPLTLHHVVAAEVDLPALLRQCGIVESPAQAELSQSFGLKVWLVQNTGFLVFLAVVALLCLIASPFFTPLVLIVPLLLAALLVPSAILTRMRVQRQRMTMHDSHLETQTGILICKHTYARYDSVKKVESIAVPFTDQGRFRVYVAGEYVIQQGQNGTRIVPYVLEGAYIDGIHDRVDAMDALLLGRIEPSAVLGTHPQGDDLVRTAKPAVANTAVVLGLISLILWPLVLVLAVKIWQIKVAQYDIESDRVVYRHGILFKSVTSVLFDRIDALQQKQGALGKAFSNGSVILLTAGSSAPDLVLGNVPDHGEVYATIRQGYGR